MHLGIFKAALLLCFASGLTAQTFDLGSFPAPLGPGQVGVPYEYSFGLENVTVENVTFSFAFTPAGGTPPPGMSIGSNGTITGTPTTAGSYSFAVRGTFTLSAQGITIVYLITFNVTIDIRGGTGPALTVDPEALSFSFTQGLTTAGTSSLSIANRSGTARTFSASASTAAGGNWLSASGGGTVSPFARAAVTVTANPAGLPVGVYSGQVLITYGNENVPVPVSMIISGNTPRIVLSQTGLSFRRVAGVNVPAEQSIQILNAGPGAIAWTAAVTTLSGGAGWLSVTPASGQATGVAPATARIIVNPAGLTPGDYYGQVEIRASGVPNSPQIVSVLLNVLPANAAATPEVSTSGLIFVGRQGQPDAAPQLVQINALSANAAMVTGTATMTPVNTALSIALSSGTVTAASPVTLTARMATGNLAPGIYRGEVTLLFSNPSGTRRLDVLGIVLPRLGAAVQRDAARDAEGCTPTKLIPVFTTLGAGFQSTAGWPTPVEVRVVDDCGDPLTAGNVTVSFSTGEPSLPLSAVLNGRWTATWQAKSPEARQAVLTATALRVAPVLSGTGQIGGALSMSTGTPAVNTGGAVSAASFAARGALAPGSMVAIFGNGLAGGLNQATQLPLTTDLGGTRLLIGGRAMPLIFTSQGQVNALVPHDLPPNTTHQLVVRRGTAYSLPESVVVAAAQPAVFTKDQSGKGAGIVAGAKADGRQFLIDAANPVAAGDVLVIYCAGLGTVDVPVGPGEASPSSPVARTTNEVTATVGGVASQVLFAGLVPGFVGLYQVNAVVPEGVKAGAEVPVVLTVAGQASPPVTIAVD